MRKDTKKQWVIGYVSELFILKNVEKGFYSIGYYVYFFIYIIKTIIE